MYSLDVVKVECHTAVGADGAATVAVTTPGIISGRLLGIACEYLSAPPAATTDVTVATKGDNGPARTLMFVENSATDWHKQPMVQASNPTNGAALAYTTTVHEVYVEPVIHDRVTVTIAGANAGDGVDVWLLLER